MHAILLAGSQELTGQDVACTLQTIIFRDLAQKKICDARLLVRLLPQDVLQQKAVQQTDTLLATGVCCHLQMQHDFPTIP